MDETEYAVALFKKNFFWLKDRNAAVYGTGINTKALLKILKWSANLLLVDDGKAGQMIFGKKVLTTTEACAKGIKYLVIVAREANVPLIYKRIKNTCQTSNVQIFDMAGRELSKDKKEKNIIKTLDNGCRTPQDKQLIEGIFSQIEWSNAQNKFLVKTPYELGYFFLAPIILKFFCFLIEKSHELKLEQLLLASRDGYIFYRIYELLKDKNDLPPMLYFYTSRSVAVLASLLDEDDILHASRLSFSGTQVELLQNRFLLSKSSIDSNTSCNVLLYCKEILKNAMDAREAYIVYLRRLGISQGARVGFFDFVTSGTLQKALQNIVDWEIIGLAFAKTMREHDYKPHTPIHTLYGEINGFQSDFHICADYVRMENILTSYEPYLIGFDAGIPKFARTIRPYQQINILKEVHKGILKFALMQNLSDFADVSKELVDLIYHSTNENHMLMAFDSPFAFEHIDEFQRHWRDTIVKES